MEQQKQKAEKRDHGGGLDAAIAQWGGTRRDWIDLSTGINPVPYPVGELVSEDWTALPDQAAMDHLLEAARVFWNVPEGVEIVAAPGASAIIAQMPALLEGTSVHVPAPTYNEHAAAFAHHGWNTSDQHADVTVLVHPNNPDGRLWSEHEVSGLGQVVIDESFMDISPELTLIDRAGAPGGVVLKSFGKFWGLAGARLGFAVCAPNFSHRLRELLGPWAVSGPAIRIGTAALRDFAWANETRTRLAQDAQRLDALMVQTGAKVVGGTPLFRLYDTQDAKEMQNHLAHHHIWSRIFPYSSTWIRLGLPAPDSWARVEQALR